MRGRLAAAGAATLCAFLSVLPAAAQEVALFAAGQDVAVVEASVFEAARSQNALDMVRHIRGFAFEPGRDGSREIADTGNVLVGGQRPQLRGRSLTTELQSIPARSVERVELIRNGARGVDMRGRTLLMNIVVRRTGELHGSLSAIGSLNPAGRPGESGSASLSRRTGQTTLDFGLDAGHSPTGGSVTLRRQVRESNGSLTGHDRQFSNGESDRVSLRAGFDGPALGGRLRLNVSDNHNESVGSTTLRNFRTGVTTVSNGSQDMGESSSGQARYTRDFDKLHLDAQFNYTAGQSRSVFQSSGGRVNTSVRDSGSQVLRGSARYDLHSKLTLEGGLESNFSWQGGETISRLNGVLDGIPLSSVDAGRQRTLAFGTATFRPNPKLTLVGGLRLDQTTVLVRGPDAGRETFWRALPNADLTWRAGPLTEFNVSLNREVQPVDIGNFISCICRIDDDDDDVIIIGNTNLTPQSEWTLRTRFQRRFDTRGLFQVTATHAELGDIVDRILLIERTIGPGGVIIRERKFEATGNIGDGYREDINVNLNLPLDRYGLEEGMLRLQSTWRDSNIIDAFTSRDRRFSGETPMSWAVGLSKEFNEGAIRTGFDANGGSPALSFRRGEVSSQKREAFLSAYAEFRATPKLTIRLDARDLTGRLQTTQRELYAGGDRTNGQISSRELRLSQASPTYELNLRRSY